MDRAGHSYVMLNAARFTLACLALTVSGSLGAEPPTFPPSKESDLVGRFTDELPTESSYGLYEKPLENEPRYSLQYRKSADYEVVLLVDAEQQAGSRKKILAALRVPPHAPDEAVNFSCREGRSGDFWGVIRNSKRPGTFRPRLAWRVSLSSPWMQRIKPSLVLCDQYGVD